MKKLFTLLLLIFLPFHAIAESNPVEIDGIYYNIISKGKVAEVTGNPKYYSGDINIPEKVKYEEVEYSVTLIGNSAFSHCTNLTSLAIPNSITSIGDYAFFSCSGLKSVTIPNSVISIGNYAFVYCISLSSITIPNSVTIIGTESFNYCENLKSVHITDLEAWCKISFSDRYSNPLFYAHHLYLNGEIINNLVIPDGITTINNVFCGCTDLTTVTLPKSLTAIGDGAFFECSGLSSVSILGNVTNIGIWSFSGCTNLASFIIPNNVTIIDFGAFTYCSSLTSVTIPENVTTIGACAFQGCKGLTYVSIGSGVHRINSKAFADCGELNDVYCYAEKVSDNKYVKEGLYCNPDAFADSYPEYITLNVPDGCVDVYKTTEPWKNFKEIVPIGASNINSLTQTHSQSENVFYNLHGQKVCNPSKGIHITNGKKVVIK